MASEVFVNFLHNPKVNSLVHKYSIILNGNNQDHVLIFRRILEISMTQGRWFGQMPEMS